MTSVSKNIYIDKLDDIVNKCNNTFHRTIKMKLADVKPSICIDFNKENNKEGPEFKAGDNVRISKIKNVFAKGYVRNFCEGDFVIKKIKNIVPLTYFISNLNGEVGTFYKKELKKNKKKTKKKKIK